MNELRRIYPAVVLAPLLLAVSAPSALAVPARQNQKLNGPLPSAPGLGGGDVRAFQLSPDESAFAYTADQDAVDVIELFAGPVDHSSAPVRVSGPLVAGGDVEWRSFRFSPDGAWLVYLADAATDETWELLSAPADGSGPARRLNGPLVEGGDVGDYYLTSPFRISGDSTRVVYLADQDVDERFELYSAPIDGSGPAQLLSGSLQPNGDVDRFRPGYAFSPDGYRVGFLADRDLDEVSELFSVPIDGSSTPVKLNLPLSGDQDVGGETGPPFLFSPDGKLVVYRADQDFPGVVNLYSVPADGSGPPRAVAELQPGQDVYEFVIAPDGTVVFRADLLENDAFELFRSPIDFGAPADRISSPLVTGGDVDGAVDVAAPLPPFQLEPTGSHVVYRADALVDNRFELFRVPVAGGGPASRLSGRLRPGGDVRFFRLDREGKHALYLADAHGTFDELYAVDVEGSRAPVRLSGSIVQRGEVQTDFQAVGDRAVFRVDGEVDERFELYGASLLDATAPALRATPRGPPLRERGPVKLHPTLAPTSDILRDEFLLTTAGSVLVRADMETTLMQEVFELSADGAAAPSRLSAALTAGPAEGDVLEFATAGPRVVYSGSQRAEGFGELFTVAPDEAPAYSQVVAFTEYGQTIREFQITPDGTRAVYVGDGATRGVFELFSVALDGGAPSVKLSGSVSTPGGDVDELFSFTPDGMHVVFRGTLQFDDVFELYVAPVDGSAPAVKLHPPLGGSLDIAPGYQISADGARVVYVADAQVDEQFALFSVPIDASAAPMRLDATSIPDGDVTAFRTAPDGSFAVYTADQSFDQRFELFRCPIDGSAAPVRLSEPLQAGGAVSQDFRITADSIRVVFVATDGALAHPELYSVRSDASQPPLRLHPQHLFDGGIGELALDPVGSRVVYVEYEDVTGHVGLFSVPADGSAVPTLIAPREPNHYSDIEGLVMSPQGAEVLYVVRGAQFEEDELYQAPLDASHEPIEHGTLHDSRLYLFTPDGQRVLIRTRSVSNGAIELFWAPADGAEPPCRLNDPLVQGGNVTSFGLASGGTGVLYRADQEEDEVFELFLAHLP